MSSEEAGPSSAPVRRRRRRILEPVPDTSSSNVPFTSPVKKRKQTTLSVGEQEIVLNVFKSVRNGWPDHMYQSNEKIVEHTALITGVSKSSIYRILKTYRDTHKTEERRTTFTHPKKSIFEKLDSFEKAAIRKKVHEFFMEGELPTIQKVLQRVNDDEQLPNFRITTFRLVMKKLKFHYVKRKRNPALIDSPEIVLWRTKYLGEILRYRNEGRRIFYLDETWVNSGHNVSKVWQDAEIKSARHAFLEGLTTGAKNPSGKGKRLIIVHIGSKEGFLEDCEWIFQSSSTGDYHESMDAQHFEEWFVKVLSKLRQGDVIVMDNASYHSRRQHKTPTMSWKKCDIQEWLQSKNINYEESETKAHLIEKVKRVKSTYQKYVCDEMANEKGITVLRLPPYHCELNPIELIWADIKGHVARNNTTFKMVDVKRLYHEGVAKITPEKWRNCVQHVLKVENEMRGMDHLIDQRADRFIIRVSSSSDSYSDSSDSEFYDS